MGGTRPRARAALVLAATLTLAAGSASASALSDVVPEAPEVPAVPSLPTGDPALDVSGVTDVVEEAAETGGLDDLVGGDGEPASQDGGGGGSGGGGNGGPGRDRGGSNKPPSARSSAGPGTEDVEGAVPAGNTADGRSRGPLLSLARPLAPAVVIAVLGLLLLAGAARGNDRLVKKREDRSDAGAWRL